MFIDDRSQVGVDQNGVWGFHVNLALRTFQLPCDAIQEIAAQTGRALQEPEVCSVI